MQSQLSQHLRLVEDESNLLLFAAVCAPNIVVQSGSRAINRLEIVVFDNHLNDIINILCFSLKFSAKL